MMFEQSIKEPGNMLHIGLFISYKILWKEKTNNNSSTTLCISKPKYFKTGNRIDNEVFYTRECHTTRFSNRLYTRATHNKLTSQRLGSVIAVINIKRSITNEEG